MVVVYVVVVCGGGAYCIVLCMHVLCCSCVVCFAVSVLHDVHGCAVYHVDTYKGITLKRGGRPHFSTFSYSAVRYASVHMPCNSGRSDNAASMSTSPVTCLCVNGHS